MIFRALKVILLVDGKRPLRLPSTECSLGLHAFASQNVARISRCPQPRIRSASLYDLNLERLLWEIAFESNFCILKQLKPIVVVATVTP